jgi:DNA polymerase-3 subunit gamma/tau
LLRYLQILQETLDAMSKYADKRLNMEMCLIRICNPSADHAPQGLLQRIEALEQALQRGAWIAAPAGQTSVSKPTPSGQMSSPEAPASPQAQESEPASSFSPPVVTESAKDSSLKPETASESTDSAAQSVSEASAAPAAESAETSAPNPSTESAASNQASATLQPFAAWNTVLDQLKAADPFIYGLVFNAIVYEKGPYLYMKSPMGSLVSSLKKDNGSSRLLAVVKQVTGNTYKLRLAKDSNSTQAKAPAVDPLLELAERARLAGVDIVEN